MSVVVTGVGVVSGIGSGRQDFATALREGRGRCAPIRSFDAGGFPVRIACEVDDTLIPLDLIQPQKALKLMNRSARFAVVAAQMARDDSGLGRDGVDPTRLGVSFGAGGMGAVDREFLELEERTLRGCSDNGEFDWGRFCELYQRLVNPLTPVRGLPNVGAANVGILQNAQGPNITVATACTSGTQAVGEALRVLQRGDADVMIAGGADAMVNPTGILGFHLLGALSHRNDEPSRASRPFDLKRDGFVMGEGAAVVVLEREEFARARGARILAHLVGYASTCDAYRMTDEHPEGDGAMRAMRGAIRDGKLDASDIGYINAHGTGTQMNDRIETHAIKRVFPGSATPPVSSTKSMMGHMLAAAGAAELVATILLLNEGLLPPTINYEEADPDCDLDYVPNAARRANARAAISNSFGFGGQNACLAIALS